MVDGPGLAARVLDVLVGAGNRVMITDEVVASTGLDLCRRIERKTSDLKRAGISETSRVGVVAWPPAEFVSDFYAVLALKGVAVPLPSTTTDYEMRRLDGIARITHLLTATGDSLYLGGRTSQVGTRTLQRCDEHTGVDSFGAAAAQMTSGTTGHPHAALRSAGSLAVEADSYIDALDLSPYESVLCPLPLHHAFGLGVCVLAAPLAGTPVVYRRADQARVAVNLLRSEANTLALAVPPLARSWARASTGPVPRASGGRVLTAGMALDRHTAELVGTVLNCGLGQVYGTTESGPICVTNPGDWKESYERVGTSLPNVTATLSEVGAHGGGDRTGLLTVRSPMSMLGYATSDGIDATPVVDGFVTGDIAELSPGGAISLVGRVSTAINVAGTKVSPEEIERVILEFPQVQSCLVLGEGNARSGQAVKAYVVPADVDVRGLAAHCRRRLSAALAPQSYEAVTELATTSTGKVLRTKR